MEDSGAAAQKVSIIIPTYNRAKLLAICLRSVLGQTHRRLEVIVIDDGSTDETDSLLQALASGDPRLKLLRQNHKGAQAARNFGYEASTGDFVSFLDDDDLWHPDKLEKQLAAFEPEVDGVICQTVWFRDWPGDHNFLFNVFDNRDYLTRFLALDVVWQTAAPLWRRAFLDQIGPWDERLTSGQDLDFHTRCLCFAPKLVMQNEVLNFFREHTGTRITKDKKEEHPGNALVAMRNAHQLLRSRNLMTPERGTAIASTVMRQSRTLALYGERDMVDECMRIALDSHPSAATRRAIKAVLWPTNRLILRSRAVRPVARALRKSAQLAIYGLGLENKRVDWWQKHPYEDPAAISSWKLALDSL